MKEGESNEGEKIFRKRVIWEGGGMGGKINMKIIELRIGKWIIEVSILEKNVIGGRGSVGKKNRWLKIGEKEIRLWKEGSEGEEEILKFMKWRKRIVEIKRINKKKNEKKRCRGERILKKDIMRWIELEKLIKDFRRIGKFLGIIEKGKIEIVIGKENIIIEVEGKIKIGMVDKDRREKERWEWLSGEVGI